MFIIRVKSRCADCILRGSRLLRCRAILSGFRKLRALYSFPPSSDSQSASRGRAGGFEVPAKWRISGQPTGLDFLPRSVLVARDLHGRGQVRVRGRLRGRVADHLRVVHQVVVHLRGAARTHLEVLDQEQRQALVHAVEQVRLADELHVGQVVLREVLARENARVVGW